MANERPVPGLKLGQEYPKPTDARQAIADLTLATGIIQQSIDFLSGQGSTPQLSKEDLERLAGLSAEMLSIVVPPETPQESQSPPPAYPEVKQAERLPPFTAHVPWRVFGKQLQRGGATDFHEMSSEYEGFMHGFNRSHVIHFIDQENPEIDQTVISARRKMDRNQTPASVYFVDWNPRITNSRGLGVVHVQRLREDFGTPPGLQARTMRPYLHKEYFHLGPGSKVLELIKQGYAIFPHFTIGDPRFNFNCSQLPRKSVTFEDASRTIIGDNLPGNFWLDPKLARPEFLPVMVKAISAIRKGDQALVLAIDPGTRQPLDTWSRMLFFQAVQHLLPVDDQTGLISFLSSPAMYTASDLTMRDPTEGRPKPSNGRRLIEIDPDHIELTGNEPQIVAELDRLFLGQIPWLDAHHEWLQTAGPRLLPKSHA